MLPYTRRACCAQLFGVILALALLVLPLAGIRAEEPTILAPLATSLIPLGSALQSPAQTLSDLPTLVTATKMVLGPLSSAAFAPSQDCLAGLHKLSLSWLHSDLTDGPRGRSPPA
jgi:hypothetical protein